MLLLSHTCTISRNTAVGTNGRHALAEVTADVPCLVIPMNAQTSIQNQFELGRGYDFYFNVDQDVRVGDKLAWSGDTYVVSARQVYNLPMVQHIHVAAKQEVN